MARQLEQHGRGIWRLKCAIWGHAWGDWGQRRSGWVTRVCRYCEAVQFRLPK